MTGRLRRGRPLVRFVFFLFPFSFVLSAALAAHDSPVNPDDPAYLRRQYAWFQAQEPVRQQQLRKLHADFQQLPPEDQTRLTRIVQTYNVWLAKLSDTDRQRLAAAPTAAERLEEIKKLREREWVDGLPKPYRDEYASLDADARRQKVLEWRAEDAERRDEWALAQRHWIENPPAKVQPVFSNDKQAIETFVGHLWENLSEIERRSLDEARTTMVKFENYFGYGFEIVRLADQHPLLPWSQVGPKEWKELPEEVRKYLSENDRHFRAKMAGLPVGVELKELHRAQGRWPEFALELANYCKKNNLKLPVPLGDCTKSQMPAEVAQFLERTLEPLLKKTDAGKADLRALEEAKGKWPDYPRLIMELAKKHKQPVPGWTLPGQPQFWDRLRAGKGKGK